MSGAVTYPCASKHRHAKSKDARTCDATEVTQLRADLVIRDAHLKICLVALESVIGTYGSQTAKDAVHAVTGAYADQVIPEIAKKNGAKS